MNYAQLIAQLIITIIICATSILISCIISKRFKPPDTNIIIQRQNEAVREPMAYNFKANSPELDDDLMLIPVQKVKALLAQAEDGTLEQYLTSELEKAGFSNSGDKNAMLTHTISRTASIILSSIQEAGREFKRDDTNV